VLLPGKHLAAPPNNQWLAMDTGSVRSIKGVATQGRGDNAYDQWVKSYKVSVSNDASSWTPVDGGRTFTGNVGAGDAVVRNDFAAVVSARYVRIEPVTWEVWISMRAGVFFEEERCTVCDAGTYKTGMGSGDCLPCEAGTYSALPGAGGCCWPPTPETAYMSPQIDWQHVTQRGSFCKEVPIYVW
jgi:hypothetical protein